jgi:1,4-dihydroxy-2-naphthoate octaprenyltransferase
MNRSTWLHLRIPFSFFLLPVYLFALCVAPEISWKAAGALFLILHFLLYPASNGYNSYFDKDQDSIGGLKYPPEVTRQLYFTSLALDSVAVIGGAFIHWKVALMLFVYGLVSKAYSHPGIRLKRYPIIGWLIAGVFQGAFTFLTVMIGVDSDHQSVTLAPKILLGAILTTLLLWGSFPMTQIYQHKEDERRGDMTVSRMLGIKGTFLFTSILFLIANIGFLWYLNYYESVGWALGFQIAMLPTIGYFIFWLAKTWKSAAAADYNNTMRLNFISSLSLNVFFLIWLILKTV